MIQLETEYKLRADTEAEAQAIVEDYRAKQAAEGYTLKKAGYEHKEKTSKGEIIDEAWLVKVLLVYNTIWG